MEIRLARIYEEQKANVYRVLCDRLWPRGVKKTDVHIQLWPKEITPSSELRKAYHKEELSFEEFSIRYNRELEKNPKWAAFKEALEGENEIVLLTSSKNIERSHLPIIKDRLLRS